MTKYFIIIKFDAQIAITESVSRQFSALAAPLLPEILLVVSRIARDTQYSWELDSNTFIPSNSRSIAKQFIRCVLHQVNFDCQKSL